MIERERERERESVLGSNKRNKQQPGYNVTCTDENGKATYFNIYPLRKLSTYRTA